MKQLSVNDEVVRNFSLWMENRSWEIKIGEKGNIQFEKWIWMFLQKRVFGHHKVWWRITLATIFVKTCNKQLMFVLFMMSFYFKAGCHACLTQSLTILDHFFLTCPNTFIFQDTSYDIVFIIALPFLVPNCSSLVVTTRHDTGFTILFYQSEILEKKFNENKKFKLGCLPVALFFNLIALL